jgi:hypothetical protein
MSIERSDAFWELSKVKTYQRSENTIDDVVRKLSIRQDIEVPHHSIRNKSSSSSWRAHCA